MIACDWTMLNEVRLVQAHETWQPESAAPPAVCRHLRLNALRRPAQRRRIKISAELQRSIGSRGRSAEGHDRIGRAGAVVLNRQRRAGRGRPAAVTPLVVIASDEMVPLALVES